MINNGCAVGSLKCFSSTNAKMPHFTIILQAETASYGVNSLRRDRPHPTTLIIYFREFEIRFHPPFRPPGRNAANPRAFLGEHWRPFCLWRHWRCPSVHLSTYGNPPGWTINLPHPLRVPAACPLPKAAECLQSSPPRGALRSGLCADQVRCMLPSGLIP